MGITKGWDVAPHKRPWIDPWYQKNKSQQSSPGFRGEGLARGYRDGTAGLGLEPSTPCAGCRLGSLLISLQGGWSGHVSSPRVGPCSPVEMSPHSHPAGWLTASPAESQLCLTWRSAPSRHLLTVRVQGAGALTPARSLPSLWISAVSPDPGRVRTPGCVPGGYRRRFLSGLDCMSRSPRGVRPPFGPTPDTPRLGARRDDGTAGPKEPPAVSTWSGHTSRFGLGWPCLSGGLSAVREWG